MMQPPCSGPGQHWPCVTGSQNASVPFGIVPPAPFNVSIAVLNERMQPPL